MARPKRIARDRCFGAIIDVQDYFLSQLGRRARSAVIANTSNFVRLLNHFRIPVVVTLEHPIDMKGSLPKTIAKSLSDAAKVLHKDYFDLTKEKPIAAHLSRLRKKQAIVAGCETDVCVLQSCLGLLKLGYEVYVVEELIFSSSRNTDAAVARLKAEGAVFLTYKTLYYELTVAVDSDDRTGRFGPLPSDLPDTAL